MCTHDKKELKNSKIRRKKDGKSRVNGKSYRVNTGSR